MLKSGEHSIFKKRQNFQSNGEKVSIENVLTLVILVQRKNGVYFDKIFSKLKLNVHLVHMLKKLNHSNVTPIEFSNMFTR